MKYLIGLVAGIVLTSIVAWMVSIVLAKDADLQISFNNLVSLSAIQNGLNEGKIAEVKIFVDKHVEYEERNILANQSNAILDTTKKKVEQVVISKEQQ